jgi:AcrR family transcriptional regulator
MKEQLNKESWVEHGVETLANHGFKALKADKMAKSLNVSRGSFYWHFKDIDAFCAAVLEHWRKHSTLQVIRDIDTVSDRQNPLEALVHRAFSSNPKLERAVRAWATQDQRVADVTHEVDKHRVGFLAQLLVSANLPCEHAEQRAVFIYWAYLGRTITPSPGQYDTTNEHISGIIKLLA